MKREIIPYTILCTTLSKKAKAVDRAINGIRTVYDLTAPQYNVLHALSTKEDGCQTMKELERCLNAAQSTVVGIVDRLVAKQLVETFSSETDHRVRVVHITPLGMQCHSEVFDEYHQICYHILEGLNETEQQILYMLLEKICPESEQ
ncbi:MAG: MarR family transcriptional regulator [Oscillospiraceae bacterium]|nr:MarR family transcriptional regulator [Oscillospiraceae bacterium]